MDDGSNGASGQPVFAVALGPVSGWQGTEPLFVLSEQHGSVRPQHPHDRYKEYQDDMRGRVCNEDAYWMSA